MTPLCKDVLSATDYAGIRVLISSTYLKMFFRGGFHQDAFYFLGNTVYNPVEDLRFIPYLFLDSDEVLHGDSNYICNGYRVSPSFKNTFK